MSYTACGTQLPAATVSCDGFNRVQLARFEADHPATSCCKFLIVRDDNRSKPSPLMYLLDQVKHGIGIGSVQVARRLIGQQ